MVYITWMATMRNSQSLGKIRKKDQNMKLKVMRTKTQKLKVASYRRYILSTENI